MTKKNFRVGVFDSGIGGLTVLQECVHRIPEVDFYYLGDNFHAPYGARPKEEIFAFVRAALKKFQRMNVDAAVLACNTATAVCADALRGEFSFPIIGTEPAVKSAAKNCQNVLLLATKATAESGRLLSLVRAERCRFTVFPAEGLAAAIEKYFPRREKIPLEKFLPRGDFDGVVLGCTHYVFLKKEIEAFYGVPSFDGGAGVAERLRTVLLSIGASWKFLLGESNPNCGIRKKIGNGNHIAGRKTTNKRSEKRTVNLTKNHIYFVKMTKYINKKRYKHMFVSHFLFVSVKK